MWLPPYSNIYAQAIKFINNNLNNIVIKIVVNLFNK